MGYYLLTGATGLLGRYLLRHLLMSDVPVAVVVRGNRIASAWQRTESVVGELEETLGRTLPRPIVLEGELTQPELGLSRETLNWVKRHCRAVLHNAASLSFQKGEPHEEPWISNVTGTQRVLELTEMCGIREFHHVSTAYVCGQRRGKVYESELDLGQEFGNDYEASKLAAEKMVRSAPWLDAPTIYRPAIIVGDSRTSFTNTFHGFYTPLQIVYSMMARVNPTDLNPQSLVEALGLAGDERKNLVPVDWIAAAITTLLREPRHHGEVYHLTPRNTTPVSTLCDVFAQATQQFAVTSGRAANSASGGPSLASLAQMFRSQMTVYQAYWRDDPEFDRTNIEAHLPELPCPVVDRATLLRLCKFAIENRFWWSRGDQVVAKFDVEQHLKRLIPTTGEPVDDGRLYTTVNLRVSGSGGGDWRIFLDDDRPHCFARGADMTGVADFHTNVDVWQALTEGRLASRAAVLSGAVAVEGSHLPTLEAEQLLQVLCQATPAYARNGHG